jgi:hypothetical protein
VYPIVFIAGRPLDFIDGGARSFTLQRLVVGDSGWAGQRRACGRTDEDERMKREAGQSGGDGPQVPTDCAWVSAGAGDSARLPR